MNFMNDAAFQRDLDALRGVSLNPARHLAPDALAHTMLVAQRVRELCTLCRVCEEDAARLYALAHLHDIGKSRGTSHPSKSVELLVEYGVDDPRLVALVKYHDVNLPWYLSHARGEAPSDRAWRKLAGQVDMDLLCLFMIADRVDCPGGPAANEPLRWFLSEARRRGRLRHEEIVNVVTHLESE